MSKKDKEKDITSGEEYGAENKKKFNSKKLKFGSMSAIVIVLVIALVIVANLMCGLLMKRYPIKLDLTPDSRYDISSETIDVLEKIDKDVEITVTTSKEYFTAMGENYKQLYYRYYGVVVECPYEIIPEILDKYSVYAESGNGSVNVKYVDITKNPDFVAQMGKYYNGEIKEGGIVVKCGERVKFISDEEVGAMIAPSQDSTQGNIHMVFTGESNITSAIRAVTDAKPVRAAVVSAMNGSPIIDQTHSYIAESFRSFLSKNGYDCTDLDIGTDDLSTEDYDLVIVAAPAIDFSEDIIAKLGDFLYNDGKYEKDMIYIPNFYATNLPNITEFLADWKLSVEPAAIIDDGSMKQVRLSSLGTTDYAPTVTAAEQTLTDGLANPALPIVAPGARAITVLSKNNESIVTEVIKSAATSYLTPLLEDTEVSKENASYNVVVRSRKETASGLDTFGSDIMVIGSPFMLDNSILSSSNTYNNANVILNSINDMTGKEASVIIPDKTFEQYTLSLTTASARVILVIVIIVIPLLIAVAGISILLWRKNK